MLSSSPPAKLPGGSFSDRGVFGPTWKRPDEVEGGPTPHHGFNDEARYGFKKVQRSVGGGELRFDCPQAQEGCRRKFKSYEEAQQHGLDAHNIQKDNKICLVTGCPRRHNPFNRSKDRRRHVEMMHQNIFTIICAKCKRGHSTKQFAADCCEEVEEKMSTLNRRKRRKLYQSLGI